MVHVELKSRKVNILANPIFQLAAEEDSEKFDEEDEGDVYNLDFAFIELRNKSTFIDRTKFINHFFERKESMVVHAPPRFGKTSILNMLEMFFEIPVDETGTVIQSYIFQKRRFFDTLRSCEKKDKRFCAAFISSHPVMYLDFAELETEDLESFCVSFRSIMCNLFGDHEYLGESPKLSQTERDIYDEERHPEGHPLLRNGTYAMGGLHLSRLLHKHFNRSCMVLVDNYDAPAAKLIAEGNKDDSMSQIFKILEDLMTGLFKDNEYVSHSLMTGVSSIGSVYTQHINSLKYYSIFENATLSKFYGLKLKDVETLFKSCDLQALLEESQRTYEGYHSLSTNEKMYAIHSLLKFMEKRGKKMENRSLVEFMEEKGQVSGLNEPIPIVLQLTELFKFSGFGETIEKTLEKITGIDRKLSFFTEQDIKNLHSLVSKPKNKLKLSVATEHLMLQFLQENGCYTIISKNDDLCRADLIVPNLEIKKLLQRHLYTESFFREKFKVTKEKLKNYVSSIIKLDKTKKSFQCMLSAIGTLFEKVLPEEEHELRAPFYSIPKLMDTESFLQVDNEVLGPNNTAIDTLIVRKDKTLIIFEFRFDRASSLTALSDVVSKKKYEVKTQEKFLNTILVGLHLNKFRNCSVSYLYNTFDIKKTVTTTVKTK
nr:PREDICTED: uncharacterized protein LOC109042306 isoform X1 [Bemisia tabaci]